MVQGSNIEESGSSDSNVLEKNRIGKKLRSTRTRQKFKSVCILTYVQKALDIKLNKYWEVQLTEKSVYWTSVYLI